MLKRVLQALGLLLLLGLLLVLAWVASNWRDVEPQALPAALALPAPAPPGDSLMARLSAAPAAQNTLPWTACKGSDCREAWAAQAAKFKAWQTENTAFGAACEALPEALPLGEALPTDWDPSTLLPAYQPVTSCANWWLLRALDGSAAGDQAGTLQALRRADRLGRALVEESRLLIGQMVGISLWDRKLRALAVIAHQQPAWRQQLLPFASLDGATLMAAARRWPLTEAAFGRGVTGSMQPAGAKVSLQDRIAIRFLHPEYLNQLSSAHWLRVLQAMAGDDPQVAVTKLREAFSTEPGPLPNGLHWQHTVAHWIHDIAVPFWPHYFDRSADLHLAAQATQLWLQGGDPSAAAPALRERLVRGADGRWTLRLWSAEKDSRMPTQWAPLT